MFSYRHAQHMTRTALIAVTATLCVNVHPQAGDFWPKRRQAQPQYTQPQTQYTQQIVSQQQVAPVNNGVAPSPMLGSFVPNNTMWVRGNGIMGGGYAPLNQDERYSLSLYGPFSASRAQMRPVNVLQPTAYGTLMPVAAGDAAAYPNYPWADTLPGLSDANRPFRPRSSAILPGWYTDSDTIDHQ